MLELKQTQKLLPVLTQQLQQAIKLLQMSQIELVEAIEQEVKENPVLEVVEREPEEEIPPDTDEATEFLERYTSSEEYGEQETKEYFNYENVVKKTTNLRDYLRWQVGLSSFDSNERIAAEWIIENIDDNGYLTCSVDEIALLSGYEKGIVESALKKIQKLDPPGVGARDLKECILLQYEAKGEPDPVFEAVINLSFNLFQKMGIKEIAKKTGYPVEEIQRVFEALKGYDPKPGRNFSDDITSYVVPDVYVVKGENGFEVYLADDMIPELKISSYYFDLYEKKRADSETRRYIKKKIKQAEWFIKSIEQRQKTLYLVSKSIVKFQEEFFEKGVRYLKPLVLKDVAQEIGVHESTVSRITTNKYMHTQFGIFELKFFFPTGLAQEEGGELSTNTVKDLIVEYIKKEDKKNPLTDDQIVNLLKEEHNIRIARRTVAKYREMAGIGSSRERKALD
ncbi:MAG: RNA polymerase factor sigma-54 [Syntrophorhabdaceae bacterium]|nr:RNA polymerase factor sigma-54 [Syntrophorhabdaceae bacterium]